MPILLSHNSSLERLRAVPPQVDTARRTGKPLQLDSVIPKGRELTRLDPTSPGVSQHPLHHVIPSSAKRSLSKDVRSHLCSLEQIPSGLLLDLGEGLYSAGPELTFIQMASQTSLVGAVVLGHELCGTYSHFSKFVSGFYDRPALTSTSAIQNAIERLKGLRGLGPARTALRWIRDGSASPMETVVSCMLHLPCSLGGFGLMPPELNCKETLDEAARHISCKKTCRVDTAYRFLSEGTWHKEGLEFDGESYHRDAEADRVRREALAHMGWTIYVVDVDDMTTYKRIKEKVALLDRVPRQRGSEEVDERKGKELLSRLLRATRFGVGQAPSEASVPRKTKQTFRRRGAGL